MKIEVAFDYASPWAFLASALAPERFAGLEVAHVPVYLRGFDAFRAGLPLLGLLVEGKAFYGA